MKIATHYEMENEMEMLSRKINAGETVATWSVQLDGRGDDIYNGTYNQCAKIAKKLAAEYNSDLIGIALVEIDADGCVVFTHDFVPASKI